MEGAPLASVLYGLLVPGGGREQLWAQELRCAGLQGHFNVT